VTRTTKTVITDNPVTIQVLQEPDLARKSIEDLVKKITSAVNLVESDAELKKDVTFRKASAGLRRAANELVGVSQGSIQSSGTSDTLTMDSEALSAALSNEASFRRFESALQRRGGVAFQLINATTGAERGLEANIVGQLRQQKGLESQIADLTAEAEETRGNLLAGLKEVATTALTNVGSQTPAQTQTNGRRVRQPGQVTGLRAAESQRTGLLTGLGNLTSATSNVLNSRNFIQGLNSPLGIGIGTL